MSARKYRGSASGPRGAEKLFPVDDVLACARAEGRPLSVKEYKKLTKPKPVSEHVEQCRLVEWVRNTILVHAAVGRSPLLNFFAVPNEGGKGKTGMIRSFQMAREGLAPGYPDCGLDVARGGYFGLRIEMKRSADFGKQAGEPRPNQSEWHARLAAEGYCVAVSWGWEPARDALLWYLACYPTARDNIIPGYMHPSEISPAKPPEIRGLRWIQPK